MGNEHPDSFQTVGNKHLTVGNSLPDINSFISKWSMLKICRYIRCLVLIDLQALKSKEGLEHSGSILNSCPIISPRIHIKNAQYVTVHRQARIVPFHTSIVLSCSIAVLQTAYQP